jgi:hypothetical protein
VHEPGLGLPDKNKASNPGAGKQKTPHSNEFYVRSVDFIFDC